MDERERPGRIAQAVGLLGILFTAAACGGSTGTGARFLKGGAGTSGLVVRTETLPGAETGRSYGPLRLEAEGAAPGTLTWSVWDGSLPAGLRLAADGTLSGTPRERGTVAFTVHVTDGPRAGLATLAVAVDDMAFWACAGLVAGEAWCGLPVALAVGGSDGPFAFDVAAAPSGGRLRAIDTVRGRAVWLPGMQGGGVCEDVLRVRDVDTGLTRTLRLRVRPDPTAVHTAEFGTTDVWYVNTDLKQGAHPFHTDFHQALAALGLRSPESTDAIGRPVDRLAALWVRRALLAELDRLYLRGEGPDRALPVSFPFEEPDAGYAKPAPATWAHALPNHFNEISVLDGAASSVVGTAFIDAAHNPLLENDTAVPGHQLGAFVNVLVDYFNVFYDGELRRAPLRDDDLPVVHALLHDLPSPGGRYGVIRRQGRQFARVLAIVLAHEIGHSLGLPHIEPRRTNALMNAQASIEPWADPAFTAENLALLRARLPGPGRGDAHDTLSKPALPDGGVSSCDGKTCNLRLPGLQRARAAGAR